MTALDFSKQVDAWAAKSKERMEAVFKRSFEITKEQVEAGTPIDTGFLVSSLTVTLGPIVGMDPKATGKDGYRPQVEAASIASATLGDMLSAGFVAVYAARIEYGFEGEDSLGRTYNQTGRGMVRLAVQNWPDNVNQAIAEAKAAAGA